MISVLLTKFSINPGAVAYRRAFYGQGTVPILLDDLRCTNTESRLIDCPYTAIDNCVHSEDAAVSCTTSIELVVYRSLCSKLSECTTIILFINDWVGLSGVYTFHAHKIIPPYFFAQPALPETSGWLVLEPMPTRVVWRYATVEHGELCAMISGVVWMQVWPADNWVSLGTVSVYCCCLFVPFSLCKLSNYQFIFRHARQYL